MTIAELPIERPDRPGPLRRAVDTVDGHPVAAVAVVGLVVAAVNIWWVATHRAVGAYNVDEVGYMATALRYQRSLDPAHPMAFVEAVGAPSNTGPLVPLLGVPGLVIGTRSVIWVMVVQSLIALGVAVAAAGLTARLAGRRAGLVAGIVVIAIPAVVNSARNFQYATGTTLFLLLSLWALLASERGTKPSRLILMGASVGAMLLTRTMSVGFLPGIGLATLLHVSIERPRRGPPCQHCGKRKWLPLSKGIKGVLGAGLATLVVAGPWWYRSRHALYDYLFQYGYGATSKVYGRSGIRDRIDRRFENLTVDIRRPLLTLAAIALVAVVVHLVTERKAVQRQARWSLHAHPLVTPVVVVLAGYGALFTTSNQGVWFEVPLEVLAACTVVALAASLWPWARTGLAVAVVAVSIVAVAVSATDRGGPIEGTNLRIRLQRTFAGGLDEKERVLGDADRRLMSNDRATREAGADAWWDLNRAVVARMERRSRQDQPWIFTLSGSSHLINSQSVLLAEEITGQGYGPLETPDTSAPAVDLAHYLQPTEYSGSHRRLLIVFRPTSLPFPFDRDVPRLLRMARTRGWQQVDRLAMPDGGDVLFLEHPERP